MSFPQSNQNFDLGGISITEVPIISKNQSDVQKSWQKSVSEGFQIDEETFFVPSEFKGSLIFDLNFENWANYSKRLNRIKVGKKALNCGDGLLSSILRHEQSHYIFSNLDLVEQVELVNSIWESNQELISAFYVELRKGHYDSKYFSEESGRKGEKIEGVKYVEMKRIKFEEKFEDVNIPRLINELIAYAVMFKSGDEFLPDAKENFAICSFAYEILEYIGNPAKDKLTNHGFWSISGNVLLKQLKNLPEFKLAKKNNIIN